MSGFFETRIENQETPAPPSAVRNLTRKKKKKNYKKRKAVSFEDSDKDSSDDKKPLSRNKFCQYHGKYIHFMDECTTLKALIKKAKSNKSIGYRKGNENVHQIRSERANWEKLKKAFKGRKKRKQESRTFEKMEVSGSEDSYQSLNDSDTSSKSDDSWSLSSNEGYLDNIKHSRKKFKTHSETFLILDQCINSKFNYESLRSHLTSHNNKKLSKNNVKETINQTDLVPITFGVLISKENTPKKWVQNKMADIRKIHTLKCWWTTAPVHWSYTNPT